jgi:hypothetical protein
MESADVDLLFFPAARLVPDRRAVLERQLDADIEVARGRVVERIVAVLERLEQLLEALLGPVVLVVEERRQLERAGLRLIVFAIALRVLLLVRRCRQGRRGVRLGEVRRVSFASS